jgi:DNA relaxase NicK
MADVAWMRNRLLILSAQEKLILAAEAMARNASFKERTAWLHKQVDPAKDRLKTRRNSSRTTFQLLLRPREISSPHGHTSSLRIKS